MNKRWVFQIAAAISLAGFSPAGAADKPYDGVTLTLASQNDQFATVLADLSPKFKEATGITVKVDILSYPELLSKLTADFVGHTKGYDLDTMDIVWSGQFAESGYTVDLTDWIKRDAAEINPADIYPVLMASLGGYKGKQVAFPFAGYANVLAYRTDLFEKAGLKPPETMEDMVADAYKLTVPPKQYGFVANGQKGPAVAQDWMQYNAEMGGSILGADGKAALNSEANIKSLTVYKALFDKAAPPGAADYDWGGREEAFRQGLAAQMQTWSVGAPGYFDPETSKVVGKVALIVVASRKGPAEEIRRRRLGHGDQRRHRSEEEGSRLALYQMADQPGDPQGLQPARRRQLSQDQRDPRSRSPEEISVPARDRRGVRQRRRRLSPAHSAIPADSGYSRDRGQRGADRQRGSKESARRRPGGSREAVLKLMAAEEPPLPPLRERVGVRGLGTTTTLIRRQSPSKTGVFRRPMAPSSPARAREG